MKASAAPALLLCLLAWPAPAIESAAAAPADGLHRCIGGDGVTIFTDKRCDDLQATESARQPTAAGPGAQVRVRSCARSQDELLFGVRSALENRNVNQLAGFYHWAGMGTAPGYRLMDRLSAFSERPLVDVQLVASAREQEAFASPGNSWSAQEPDRIWEGVEAAEAADAAVAPARPARAADLLRVDQMRGNDDVAAQVTYFHLRSNAGCWWLQF